MVDIFSEAKEKVMPKWAKFVNDGDKVQGTYVGKIVGQIDGYGNEQIIYQLLQDDGEVVNVGFGLNKKVLHQDMTPVKFGQIVGFLYKGTITVKDKFQKPVNVKDYALHQDPKIVDTEWLKANEGNMPEVTKVTDNPSNAQQSAEDLANELKADDVPFSSSGSLTNEDKLKVITKLATEKLGATDSTSVKEKTMEALGVAFIPVNFQKLIDGLTAM